MNKTIMDDFRREETSDWSFPRVDQLINADYAVDLALEKLKNESIAIAAEAENLKNDYQKKLILLNTMIAKLENPLAILDTETLDWVQYIIKNAVKKIIYKELDVDPKWINKIIHELSGLIQSQNGPVTVYVSEIDYKKINTDNASPTINLLKIDDSLIEGDVIVKSQFTEIRAVITERIDQILGDQDV